MKKIIISIIMLMTIFIPCKVFAAGSIDISEESMKMNKGETKDFTITATNAAGKISISASDESIIQVEVQNKQNEDTDEEIFLDNSSKTIEVTALDVGECTINIELVDVITYDLEELTGVKKVDVDVVNVVATSTTKSADADVPSSTPKTSITTKTTAKTVQNPKTKDLNIILIIFVITMLVGAGVYSYERLKKVK